MDLSAERNSSTLKRRRTEADALRVSTSSGSLDVLLSEHRPAKKPRTHNNSPLSASASFADEGYETNFQLTDAGSSPLDLDTSSFPSSSSSSKQTILPFFGNDPNDDAQAHISAKKLHEKLNEMIDIKNGFHKDFKTHTRFVAVCIHWEDTNISQARREVDDIRELLSDPRLGFETQVCTIPSTVKNQPQRMMTEWLRQCVVDVIDGADTNTLVVVYYSGHACLTFSAGGAQKLEFMNYEYGIPGAAQQKIDWTAIQGTLINNDYPCDIWGLLDCCYSGPENEDADGKTRFAFWGASTGNLKAPARGETFTTRLIAVMKDWLDNSEETNMPLDDLYESFVAEERGNENQRPPLDVSVFVPKSRRVGGIQLVKKSVGDLLPSYPSTTRQLLKPKKTCLFLQITLNENPTDADLVRLVNFITPEDAPEIIDLVRYIDSFPSNSTVMLVLFSVKAWLFFPRHPAVRYMGVKYFELEEWEPRTSFKVSSGMKPGENKRQVEDWVAQSGSWVLPDMNQRRDSVQGMPTPPLSSKAMSLVFGNGGTTPKDLGSPGRKWSAYPSRASTTDSVRLPPTAPPTRANSGSCSVISKVNRLFDRGQGESDMRQYKSPSPEEALVCHPPSVGDFTSDSKRGRNYKPGLSPIPSESDSQPRDIV